MHVLAQIPIILIWFINILNNTFFMSPEHFSVCLLIKYDKFDKSNTTQWLYQFLSRHFRVKFKISKNVYACIEITRVKIIKKHKINNLLIELSF